MIHTIGKKKMREGHYYRKLDHTANSLRYTGNIYILGLKHDKPLISSRLLATGTLFAHMDILFCLKI